jgi:adenine phosphoribosyltransferase
MAAIDLEELRRHIRDIPGFPQPGVVFRDITPLLAAGPLFAATINAMAAPFAGIDTVVAIESRGFILGAPVAYRLGAGLVPVRKVGRLPHETLREEYALEYGSNTVEIHRDGVKPGERVLIVDDVLATGGTVRAAANLVEQLGAHVAGISLLIELTFLNGRSLLGTYDVRSLLEY